jgi:ubiquinone/menaquinone biosynthesis C-methylase UbiE
MIKERKMDEIALQRKYYSDTSHAFDSMHIRASEHVLACHLLAGFLKMQYPHATILDVGAGTGRLFEFVKEQHLPFGVMGIEPSVAQRNVAYAKGIRPDMLIDGDATKLRFPEDHFDFCTEFGVLHHIREYRQAVREICRVASKGVFLSDSNNFGQGQILNRIIKRSLRTLGLWKLTVLIKTRGRGYNYSDGDGLFYSFTLFNCMDILRQKFPNIYIWTTKPTQSGNVLFGADHLAILAHK